MATWNLYGVFTGTRWGMTTNKKVAIATAKEHKGFVRSMPYPRGSGAWDCPTFYACSAQLDGADFREEVCSANL